MNVSFVCLVALAAAPAADDPTTVYTPSEHFVFVPRGQTPGYDELPPQSATPPAVTPPANGYDYDPFLGSPGGVYPDAGCPDPYGSGACAPWGWELACPPPEHFKRWTSSYEVGFLSKEPTEFGMGSFGITEIDAGWRYATPLSPGWVFSFGQEFGVRFWDGPRSSPALPGFGLPGTVYRIGADFELATPPRGPWSTQLGFTPSINTDFNRRLTRRALNFDGRAILVYQASPFWAFLLGLEYLDRVNDYFIPHVGVVWTPDDRWEWKLAIPEPRVSYFLGDIDGFNKWLYLRGQFHAEAYEIRIAPADRREQIELTDFRLLLGLQMENSWASAFIEGGVVFERRVEFRESSPDFGIGDGFVGRAGIRF